MRLSVVVSTQPAKFAAATFKGDLNTNLAAIASLGYQGVELAIRDPNILDAAWLERATRAHGLAVPAIGTGQAWGEEGLSFTDPDPSIRRAAIERIKSHIPVAARFGAVIIIGLIRGTVKPGVVHAQALDWLTDGLRECGIAAQLHGIRLALEPINRYETTLVNRIQQGLELIDRVGAANLGLLLDTFHMNIEEARIEDAVCACSGHIFHFHVADSNRWYPGGGHLDFRSVLNALANTGYQGWLSGEFLPEPDALTAARNAIAHLSQFEPLAPWSALSQ